MWVEIDIGAIWISKDFCSAEMLADFGKIDDDSKVLWVLKEKWHKVR